MATRITLRQLEAQLADHEERLSSLEEELGLPVAAGNPPKRKHHLRARRNESRLVAIEAAAKSLDRDDTEETNEFGVNLDVKVNEPTVTVTNTDEEE